MPSGSERLGEQSSGRFALCYTPPMSRSRKPPHGYSGCHCWHCIGGTREWSRATASRVPTRQELTAPEAMRPADAHADYSDALFCERICQCMFGMPCGMSDDEKDAERLVGVYPYTRVRVGSLAPPVRVPVLTRPIVFA